MTTPERASATRIEPIAQPKFSKRWRALAGLAVTSLILGACAGPTEVTDSFHVSDIDNYEPGMPSKPTDEVAPEGLDDFYNATIDWYDCGQKYECGELEVPMDYNNPDGDVFTLALGRRAAMDPPNRIGSLLLNPGGPGGSGLNMLDSAGLIFTPGVLASYDIIGFDPRGVGESEPAVACLSDEERDERRAKTFDVDTDEGMRALLDEAAEYARKCAENTGPGMQFIDTVSAATDMDLIRSAVGDEKLSYIGFSYGTFLGATYAELFPEKVERLVLDGALDPSLTYEEVGAGQAKGFDRALRAYIEYCLGRTSCPLSGNVDSAMQDLYDFLEGLDDSPLPVMGDDRVVTGDFAFSGLILTLYSRDSWSVLNLALASAMNDRDGTILMSLADLGAYREDDGTYTPGTEAFTAINCLDYDPSSDVDFMRADAEELNDISYFFGPALAYGGVTCADWPYETKRTPHEISATGAGDILVVGTTRDPATPYEWSVALDEQLENSVLVTFDGDGHTAYGNGNECIEDAVDGFLLDGVMPEPGLVCN